MGFAVLCLKAAIFMHAVSPCTSADTWVNSTEYEYFYASGDTVSWYSARANCQGRGADLASVFSEEEATFIKDSVINEIFGFNVWLGMTRSLGVPDFRWLNGESLGEYIPWKPNEPKDGIAGELCAYMDSQKKWSSANCGHDKARVLCKRSVNYISTTPSTSTTTAPNMGYCPVSWVDTGSKCLKLFRSSGAARTWEEALRDCRSKQGKNPDLASIHSQIENAYLTAMMEPEMGNVWIGLIRDFVSIMWSDNSDTDFKNGQIIGEKYRGTIVSKTPAVTGSWQWADKTTRLPYICQTHKDSENIIPTPAPTPSHACPNGFRPYQQACYRFGQEAMVWSEAEGVCSSFGAHMVAVHSEQENAALLVIAAGQEVWLGMKKGASGELEWSNGEYVIYTKWSDSYASSGGDCVYQRPDPGTWGGKACTEKLPFVCKISNGPVLTTPPQIEGKCPPEGDWEPHGSYCYKFSLGSVRSWYKAMDECLAHYQTASLVSIHHMVDNDWLYHQVEERCGSSGCFSDIKMFIGLHKSRRDNSLKWVDGSSVQFTHWAPGSQGTGSCAVMSTHFKSMWLDVDCDTASAGYICKAPKRPKPTAPTQGPGQCPGEEWESYGSTCFLFKPDGFSRWYEAQESCLGVGGNLASVFSEHENDYIHEQILNKTHLPKHRPFWLGAMRINSSSVFGWLGGVGMTYSHWGQQYPKHNTDDCVQVDPETSIWKNEDCQQRAGFVCRFDKVPPATVKSPSSGISGGGIAGIVIGIIGILGALIAVGYVIYLRRTYVTDSTFNNPLTLTKAHAGNNGLESQTNSNGVGFDNPAMA